MIEKQKGCGCLPPHNEPCGNFYFYKTETQLYMPCKAHEQTYKDAGYTKHENILPCLGGSCNYKNTKGYTLCGNIYTYGGTSVAPCMAHEQDYIDGRWAVIGSKQYPTFVEEFGKLTLPEIKESGDFKLYHLIFHSTPDALNFVTFARSEKEAKEKIIKKYKNSFRHDFEETIEKLGVYEVTGEVAKIY